MKQSRRTFLKQGLAGTLLLGATSVPAPLRAMFGEIGPTNTGRTKRVQRVLLIALDGICVDGFHQAKTPNLDALLADGVLSVKTRVVMPSVTLPNWTSHLSGSGPEQHGVTDNNWELGKDKYLFPVEKDKDGYYPSVFQKIKENLPECKTAFYYNWANLIKPYNKVYLDEMNYLEDDAYIPNYEKAFDFMVRNRNLPELVFLYSVHTDHAGHAHKWMSPEYIRSIEEADVQIGNLLDKMKKARLFDDTCFMFLTDHGGIEYGHGGLSEEEMIVPWGIVGPGIKRGIVLDEANNTVNTAAIILHLFGIDVPSSWTGKVLLPIFK